MTSRLSGAVAGVYESMSRNESFRGAMCRVSTFRLSTRIHTK